jgi:hypothetical protein
VTIIWRPVRTNLITTILTFMQAKEIIPLLYDEDYTQWEYNNFIYRVNLAKPITSFTSAQP